MSFSSGKVGVAGDSVSFSSGKWLLGVAGIDRFCTKLIFSVGFDSVKLNFLKNLLISIKLFSTFHKKKI